MRWLADEGTEQVPGTAARRAVFLDRDGCINRMVYLAEFGLVDSPQNPDQFQLLPGVGGAIRAINELGWLAVVVSNQPGIAKGKSSPSLMEATTQKLHCELEATGARLDAVYYCLHHPEAELEEYRVACACRKPRPGLLRQAAADLDIDLTASVMIGDGLTDVQAGKAVGCATILLGRRRCDLCEVMADLDAFPDLYAPDLPAALELVRAQVSGTRDPATAKEGPCHGYLSRYREPGGD